MVRPLEGAPIKNNRVQRLFRLHSPANAGKERRLPGPQACAKSLFAVRIVGAGFIPPGHFPPPQTATAARGLAALRPHSKICV